MSGTALDWRAVWGDNASAGREFRTFHVSRDEALAACDPGRHGATIRVQGPNGVVIERTETEQIS